MSELADEINNTLSRGPYRVASGDVIEVSFAYQPEWNQTVTVRPDGRASFLSTGEMEVAGRTIDSVTKELSARYAALSTSGVTPVPTLNVSLLATQNDAAGLAHQVIVVGELKTPGPITLGGAPLSLVEAIGRAGGPIKETALLEETLLVRLLPDEGRRVHWKIDASVDQWGLSRPILLQAHDVVFVPNKPIDNVNIWIDQYIRKMMPISLGFAIPIP